MDGFHLPHDIHLIKLLNNKTNKFYKLNNNTSKVFKTYCKIKNIVIYPEEYCYYIKKIQNKYVRIVNDVNNYVNISYIL